MLRVTTTRWAGTVCSLPAWIPLSLVALGSFAPARAQLPLDPCLDCPVPDLEYDVVLDTLITADVPPDTSISLNLHLDWPEVGTDEGRSTSTPAVSWAASPAQVDSSSTIRIVGDYVLDCDYRLDMSKVPEPVDDVGLVPRIRYEIRENVQGTGAALARDTISVAQADSVYLFDPAIAGNLGVSFSTNINQPSELLGTIPVTISGLNTANAISSRFVVQAMNTVNSLADGLMVEVRGPLGIQIPVVVPLTVTTPGTVYPIMNGMEISFGDGSAAAADSVLWSARFLFPADGEITIDMEAFEGYHVWRSEKDDLDDFTLLGEIQQCESKFEFILINQEEFDETDIELIYDPIFRTFELVDTTIHRDFPYRYAISTFDRGFLGNNQGRTFGGMLRKTPRILPGRPHREQRQRAFVVPNPYKRRAAWEEGQPKVVFSNLPTECTIRVFTEALDLVATMTHSYPSDFRSTSPTSREWNLTSDRGVRLAPGIYIFHIEGVDRGPTGSGNERFEQTGKMIIIR